MSATDPGSVTPDVILSHPEFLRARAAYIDAIVEMYEADLASIELMLDGGRIQVFGIIMCLWGACREDVP